MLFRSQFRLRNELVKLKRNPDELKFHLLSSSDSVLPTHNAGVRSKFASTLAQRGVQVHLSSEVTKVESGKLITSKGQTLDADEIIWVTRAGGAAWLQQTSLDLDKEGFIKVTDTLQSPTDPLIFAAGDIASMQNYRLEKAGVFAVRMAKPLTENLRRAVAGTALLPYSPQTSWLALISTGDKYAVASRGWLGLDRKSVV